MISLCIVWSENTYSIRQFEFCCRDLSLSPKTEQAHKTSMTKCFPGPQQPGRVGGGERLQRRRGPGGDRHRGQEGLVVHQRCRELVVHQRRKEYNL